MQNKNNTLNGCWQSDMQSDSVFRGGRIDAYPFVLGDELYWLETRFEEQGRAAIVKQSKDHSQQGITTQCITPGQFNIRTRVNEYGGKCFCVCQGWLVFNHYADNRLYVQRLDCAARVEALFASDGHSDLNANSCGFADLTASADGRWIIAIHETVGDHGDHGDHRIEIVVIAFNPETGTCRAHDGCFQVLQSAANFYACPVLSPDMKRLAWVEWDHPNMPWDESRLACAEVVLSEDTFSLAAKKLIVNERQTSVCQPGFSDDNQLLFVMDGACDYWNFFRFDGESVIQITHHRSEYGDAHWQFGQTKWQPCGAGKILAVASEGISNRLVCIDVGSGEILAESPVRAYLGQLLRVGENQIVLIASEQRDISEIWSVDDALNVQVMKRRFGPQSNRPISEPEHISFASGAGVAHGVFYPPCNQNYASNNLQPPLTMPPLIVMLHGGPTARTSAEYNGVRQYFCSLGYALLDVNYRGSSGYGRRYRQSLLGHWGESEVQDVIAGIGFLTAQNRINSANVFIRGSSAGGYSVLRALTCHADVFAAGASYYGIGNLVTLAEITHHFESCYTDNLIGETFNAETAKKPVSRYFTRSPINYFDHLDAPLIIFQGGADRVVPVELAQEIVAKLRIRNVPHRYVEYPDEGHGFRNPANRIDALLKEAAFFADIIHTNSRQIK